VPAQNNLPVFLPLGGGVGNVDAMRFEKLYSQTTPAEAMFKKSS
jgi:hypothetical protein